MTKTYQLKFTRGFGGAIVLTVFSLTVFLIPLAIIMLIESIELREKEDYRE